MEEHIYFLCVKTRMEFKKAVAYGGIVRNSLFESSNNDGERYNYNEFFESSEFDPSTIDGDIVRLSVSVSDLYSVLEF